MPVKTLKDFLDKNHVKYLSIKHSPAFTAQEIAELSHIHGKQMAKVVVLKIDGRMDMAVTGAHHRLDLTALAEKICTNEIFLADEKEFKNRFPDCEVGAMPPFGNLYSMDVYVDSSLAENSEIVFNAGSHTEVIRMSFADFSRLVKPKIF
ncbi:MAG: YbaK/EbsC family protein [Candidatus Latescibacter sp.]|nr:YbaK/EbsC family protein [Candidatus Latescibacter sp.]